MAGVAPKCSAPALRPLGFGDRWQRRALAVPSAARARRANALVARSKFSEVESMNKHFGIKGIEVESGLGDLPKVVLCSSEGSTAEIYLFGACITSWRTVSGDELLFVRPDAVFDGTKPISGGIPHCFPQFGPGVMQQHGFARNVPWTLSTTENYSGCPSVTLELEPSDYSRNMWDCDFKIEYKVTLEPEALKTHIHVKNVDNKEFSFTTALHNYFHAAIGDVCIKGLKGCKTLNKDPDPKNPTPGVEKRDEITFSGFYDCMYLNAPREVILENGLGNTISIRNKGWTDAVLWNPYLTLKESYLNFVCVENAKLDKVVLQPGEAWAAEQFLRVCSE
ncbi:putative glucose-6-phosphate 1-epimerase [Selaginella moellendorffii]|uniref:putative glucose-6-phosphate 1-epimerase n=1 Tax=Selaginella moellendorffii TaxID=88036 RepID=UPI000D1C8AB7|nr:putative glucose-6-phosphate 1-epimerase [Selaginella moellendorffii]|eukprot:XP_024540682.1 putative glucose-6-phosphate 1-epimerase [Selaginella moellendorffii]